MDIFDYEHTGIIYRVTNLTNGKLYVGQTTRPLRQRYSQHRRFKNGTLYPVIQKYSDEELLWEIVCECSNIDDLNYCEDFIIRRYVSDGYTLYNRTVGGGLNAEHTDEVKKRISDSLKGRFTGEDNSMYGCIGAYHGKSLSEEHRRKMSESHKGKPLTNEHRALISDGMKYSYSVYFDDGSVREYINADQRDICKEIGLGSAVTFRSFFGDRKPFKGIVKIEKMKL